MHFPEKKPTNFFRVTRMIYSRTAAYRMMTKSFNFTFSTFYWNFIANISFAMQKQRAKSENFRIIDRFSNFVVKLDAKLKISRSV